MERIKMTLSRRFVKFYGDANYWFDIIIALIIVGMAIGCFIVTKNMFRIDDNLLFSIIEFFGVLAGFLLTSFSLLYLYNPIESDKMQIFRKSTLFKKTLKAFLSAIIVAILAIGLAYVQIMFNPNNIYAFFLLFIIIFTVLRLIKCIFYLFLIIDISIMGDESSSKRD
jgi:hypothetical protein